MCALRTSVNEGSTFIQIEHYSFRDRTGALSSYIKQDKSMNKSVAKLLLEGGLTITLLLCGATQLTLFS